MITTKFAKYQFISGNPDPRNHAGQLKMDEKHRQWDWAEGFRGAVSKLALQMSTL
jgi:hypothetical protein